MSDASPDPLSDPDLDAAAEDELARALTLSWAQLAKVVPWGDTFEGFSPANRPVMMERSYIWAADPGGDVLCEVAVFPNAVLYDHAARRSARVPRPR